MKIHILFLSLGIFFSTTLFTQDVIIDALVQETLTEWQIPGLALAIVKNGKRLKVAGYGVRARGENASVDDHTLFQLCSLTKSFTASAISMLVDEGMLDWERPIIEYIPTFRLKDSFATQKMTLIDLLSHKTGLPGVSKQSRRLWYHTDRSTDELICRLRNLEFAFPFRSHFTYNHMSCVLAAKVLEKVTGMPWSRFCREKIFLPLKMLRTNTSYDDLMNDDNHASPHFKPTVSEKPIRMQNWDNIAPAVGINSCADDMARWLLFCLERPAQQTQMPHTVFEREGLFEYLKDPGWPIFSHEQPVVNYGLGWMMYSLDNKKVLFHIGLGDGMQSIAVLVPEIGLGIVVLTNQSPQLGAAVLLNQLLDMFLCRLPDSWPQKARDAIAEIDRRKIQRKKELEMTRSVLPSSCAFTEYEGMYEHPAYGAIRVFLDGNNLAIEHFTHEKARLVHWGGDTFKIDGIFSLESWLVRFLVSSDRLFSLEMGEMGIFVRKNCL